MVEMTANMVEMTVKMSEKWRSADEIPPHRDHCDASDYYIVLKKDGRPEIAFYSFEVNMWLHDITRCDVVVWYDASVETVIEAGLIALMGKLAQQGGENGNQN